MDNSQRVGRAHGAGWECDCEDQGIPPSPFPAWDGGGDSPVPCGNNLEGWSSALPQGLRDKLREQRCSSTCGSSRPSPAARAAPLRPSLPGAHRQLGADLALAAVAKEPVLRHGRRRLRHLPPLPSLLPGAASAAQRGPALPANSSAPRPLWRAGLSGIERPHGRGGV